MDAPDVGEGEAGLAAPIRQVIEQTVTLWSTSDTPRRRSSLPPRRRLHRGRDAGDSAICPARAFAVQPLRIALLAHVDAGVQIHLDEPVSAYDSPARRRGSSR